MAYKAMYLGKVYEANDVPQTLIKEKFVCCVVDGCAASMHLVRGGSKNPYFASYHKNEHLSYRCVPIDLSFDRGRYTEEGFSLDTVLCNAKSSPAMRERKQRRGSKSVHVRTAKKYPIRTFNMFYRACCSLEKADSYGNYKINDIFADYTNVDYHLANPYGLKIMELSFYRFDNGHRYLVCNYPPLEPGVGICHIVLSFPENRNDLYEFYRDKFLGGTHMQIFAVIGEFGPVSYEDCIAQCIITSKGQFCFLKW